MVTEKQRPLTVFGNRRRLRQNIDDRKSVFHPKRHKHARHDRKVKRHVALIATSEIGDGVFRPLIRFRQQHAISKTGVHLRAKLL